MFIWLWGLENADKYGRLKEADDDDIAEAISGTTDIPCSKVVEALFETEWLDKIDGATYLHDWDVWQEQWYKAKDRREADKLRKRNDRKAQKNQKPEIVEENPEKIIKPQLPKPEEPKKTEAKSKFSTDFEVLWKIYPRHVGKAEAYEKYKARLKDGWSKEQLLEATEGYAAQVKRLGTQQEYIKHGRTFFGPNTPFVDFLKNKGSLVESLPEDQLFENPFEGYTETFYGNH